MNDGDQQTINLLCDAKLKEYEYVLSLILMYRRFQMQIFGLAIAVYAAFIGLIGSVIGAKAGLDAPLSYAALFAPWLFGILVASFWTMELRMWRASRFIRYELATELQEILGRDVFTFEEAPGRYISKFEKLFSSSISFLTILIVPPLVFSFWHIKIAKTVFAEAGYIYWIGLAFLCVTGGWTLFATIKNEMRR